MGVNIRGKSFLKLLDFTSEEIRYLVDLSKEFKRLKLARTPHKYLDGRNIVLLFEKTSTRTRCSFEVAGYDLGMGVTYLDPGSSQISKKESIADTARVLGRMYDGIEYRGFDQKIVEELAEYAGVPVWNGLTDAFHPTQMIADMMTIEENFADYKGRTLAFVGYADACVGNSLMVLCAKMGINFNCIAPKEMFCDAELVKICNKIAKKNNCVIKMTTDMMEGTKGVDIIYTDVWVALGEPQDVWEHRIKIFKGYTVDEKTMANASKNAIFMHCLPAFHDLKTTIGKDIYDKYNLTEMEVNDVVFESKQSKVFDEAENRLHSIKAIMYATLT